ncbi:MAG: hypothetical protein IKB05_02500 [Alphaproteobacteria bacterium]|nr:hypothetical protein [Alphaproteobacteria bacterium]
MKIYKLAITSMVAGFATAAFAAEIATTSNVAERKSCDQIASEIAELSAIIEPDTDTIDALTKLKQQQRSLCQKRAGLRSTATTTRQRTNITPDIISQSEDIVPEPTDTICDTPDENGCCPDEIYTDMGDLGFNCCPKSGGDCFPPIVVSVSDETITETEPTPEPELSDEQIKENIEAGLCADGTTPNKFGCCGDEVFKDMGNTVFACCPKSGGDCFPPIK